GVAGKQLEALAVTLVELNEAAVINGISAAVIRGDPAEVGIGPVRADRARVTIERDRRSIGEAARHRYGGKQVDIARMGQMLTVNAQISQRHGRVPPDL